MTESPAFRQLVLKLKENGPHNIYSEHGADSLVPVHLKYANYTSVNLENCVLNLTYRITDKIGPSLLDKSEEVESTSIPLRNIDLNSLQAVANNQDGRSTEGGRVIWKDGQNIQQQLYSQYDPGLVVNQLIDLSKSCGAALPPSLQILPVQPSRSPNLHSDSIADVDKAVSFIKTKLMAMPVQSYFITGEPAENGGFQLKERAERVYDDVFLHDTELVVRFYLRRFDFRGQITFSRLEQELFDLSLVNPNTLKVSGRDSPIANARVNYEKITWEAGAKPHVLIFGPQQDAERVGRAIIFLAKTFGAKDSPY